MFDIFGEREKESSNAGIKHAFWLIANDNLIILITS